MPNVTAYLSDELAARVKEHELSLSALLQSAAKAELARLDELAAAQDGMTPQKISTLNRDGQTVLLRFTGKQVYRSQTDAYLTEEGTVILVLEETYLTFVDVDEFVDWVDDPARSNLGGDVETDLREAVVALGGPRVVEIR